MSEQPGSGVYLISGVHSSASTPAVPRCDSFYGFVDFGVSGAGYYESRGGGGSGVVSACRYLWKDVQSGTWVIGSGPIDADVNVPPLPSFRSVDTPWCVEDVTQWVELRTTTTAAVATQTMQLSGASVTPWFAGPRFRQCNSSSNASTAPPSSSSGSGRRLSSSTTSSSGQLEHCYKFEYGPGLAYALGVKPITGMPASHPTVTRRNNLLNCTTRLSAGDPIPASGFWHRSGCSQPVVGGDLFYAYGFPSRGGQNTGFAFRKGLAIYFLQTDDGNTSLVLTVGKPKTSSGKLHLDATSTGLLGTAAGIVRSDDKDECTWDASTASFRCRWRWARRFGDGAVIGPLPSKRPLPHPNLF